MNILVIGADRGLGKILCEKLADRGHRVVAGVYDSRNIGKSLFESDHISAYQMDVADEESLQKASVELRKTETVIDAVVHVAGVLMDSDRKKTLLDANMDDLMTAFQINAGGIIMSFRTFYPFMKKNGLFIAVTSEGGSFSNAGDMFPAYGITKTAANKVVQVLRCTVDDVEIIAVHPGRMNTEMGRTTAQMEPEESADGFCRILESINKREPDDWFIDYKGEKMPL